MKIAAAEALASLVSDEELNADYILPYAFFDKRVREAVSKAVFDAAHRSVRRRRLIRCNKIISRTTAAILRPAVVLLCD